jgi:ubiquinone/menaquinone biosynthesis C-methylase UbiE
MKGRQSGDATAGHRVYTSRFLSVYDLVVLGWFSKTAWRCPAAELTGHYDTHVSANHLDVGVGTGYFLDHCTFPTPRPRLALMDVNPACLATACRRGRRFQPETYTANVLEPLAAQLGNDIAGFDSIGMTYLLHCLPGTISEKSVVFENLLALAKPGATLFGATLLHEGVNRNWYARRVMAFNNRRRIFSNTGDDLVGLESVLSEHLEKSSVRVMGCVAMFSGTA